MHTFDIELIYRRIFFREVKKDDTGLLPSKFWGTHPYIPRLGQSVWGDHLPEIILDSIKKNEWGTKGILLQDCFFTGDLFDEVMLVKHTEAKEFSPHNVLVSKLSLSQLTNLILEGKRKFWFVGESIYEEKSLDF